MEFLGDWGDTPSRLPLMQTPGTVQSGEEVGPPTGSEVGRLPGESSGDCAQEEGGPGGMSPTKGTMWKLGHWTLRGCDGSPGWRPKVGLGTGYREGPSWGQRGQARACRGFRPGNESRIPLQSAGCYGQSDLAILSPSAGPS